jgi:hypothetical protein
MRMFGQYDIPTLIEQEGITVSVQKEGENILYRRECLGENIEKILVASSGKLLLNPVEPVNKPKAIASHLLIEFANALQVEPRGTMNIFLTFPVEISVFIPFNEELEVIDTFTLARQKFTLYGDPISGVICKYWKSSIYTAEPSLNRIEEGIIGLTIANTSTNWIEVTKAIFNAYGMKIYYNDERVSMKANMRLKSAQSAETEFLDDPLSHGMSTSIEMYTSRKLSIAKEKFNMEFGL